MIMKIPQKLLLCCIISVSLAACKGTNLQTGLDAVQTPLVSEPTMMPALPTTASLLTAEVCLNHTPGEGECKDCCDSLDTDGAGRKACRDTCPGHDFSQNSDFIAVDMTSFLGPNGDYSFCISDGSQGACKECCDSSTTLQNGDRRYCRVVCNQLTDARSDNPNPTDEKPDQAEIKPEAGLLPVTGEYIFAEGPAVDNQGNVYFSDISAGRIYQWSPDGSVSVFKEGLNGPNGLEFTREGLLIVCEGGNGRLISIDSQGQITPLVEQYNQSRFNEPNDLWIDPSGGIYFTDPAYQSTVVQDGEHVYYLFPDRSQVIRVISDMVKPNGIVGTGDGKMLYVTDHGAGQTFTYNINPDGTLTDKKLFASLGSDGMTLDASGNLYLTTPNRVQVLSASGDHLLDLPTQENPTNVTFGGADHLTLFITARTAVYTLQMQTNEPGSNDCSNNAGTSAPTSDTEGFTLSSSEVIEAGVLPTEYTCDGASATLPLSWSGAPSETRSFAVVMHHVAGPGDTHWYWILYDIPANVTSLSKNSTGVGNLGTNGVNGNTGYSPPCSKGPGEKVYTYTVYALSAQPQFSVSPSQISRDVLLEAIQDITIASAELHVTYSRK